MLANIDPKPITADTISAETFRAAGVDQVDGFTGDKPPSLEQLVDLQPDGVDRDALRALIQQVPEGFRIVPVVYSPIPSDVNRDIWTEFSDQVEPALLRRLATEDRDKLQAIGLDGDQIDEMAQGFLPTDKASGEVLPWDVDHIIERKGSGGFGLTKALDPAVSHDPEGRQPHYLVNHFDNLILLHKDIHNHKNEINRAQLGPLLQRSRNGDDRPAWVAMMIPDTPEKTFVHVPAAEDLERFRNPDFHRGVGDEVFFTKMALNRLFEVEEELRDQRGYQKGIFAHSRAVAKGLGPSEAREWFLEQVNRDPEASVLHERLVQQARRFAARKDKLADSLAGAPRLDDRTQRDLKEFQSLYLAQEGRLHGLPQALSVAATEGQDPTPLASLTTRADDVLKQRLGESLSAAARQGKAPRPRQG